MSIYIYGPQINMYLKNLFAICIIYACMYAAYTGHSCNVVLQEVNLDQFQDIYIYSSSFIVIVLSSGKGRNLVCS